MYEKQVVKETLKEHQERDYCLDEQMVSSLERGLNMVLDVIHAKNKDAFQMAKNMVLVLYDVLTAKDKSEFEGYSGSFNKDQFAALLELYSLCKAEDSCRSIFHRLLRIFSGRCSSLVGSHACAHWNKLKLAESDPDMVNMLPELREKAEKADEAIEKVNEFIAKHRIEEANAPKFKMKW